MTSERFEQLDELLCDWNQKEAERQEDTTDDWVLGNFEAASDAAKDKQLVARAAIEMGISEEELREYFRQSERIYPPIMVEERIEGGATDEETRELVDFWEDFPDDE